MFPSLSVIDDLILFTVLVPSICLAQCKNGCAQPVVKQVRNAITISVKVVFIFNELMVNQYFERAVIGYLKQVCTTFDMLNIDCSHLRCDSRGKDFST